MFGMNQVQRPPPVLMPPRNHDIHRLTDPRVRPHSRTPQIIEAAQHIVMPKRRKREPQPAFVDRFSGSKRAKHVPLEQISLTLVACVPHSPRLTSSSFVFDEAFQHTNRRMK